MEYLDVLDERGEKTGEVVERSFAHKHGIFHRAIHVWIINSCCELLIQRRSVTKDWMPNKLYVSMGCHVIAGESNKQAIIREMDEELGIDVRALTDELEYLYTFKERSVTNDGTFIDDEFYDVYVLKLDIEHDALHLQAEEVASAQWMPYTKFRQMILDHSPEFVDHGDNYLPLIASLDALF